MVPEITALSEKEKDVLDRYAPLLSKMAKGFAADFFERPSEREKFLSLLQKDSSDGEIDDGSVGYREALILNEKTAKTPGPYSDDVTELPGNEFLSAYETFYDVMQKTVDSMDIPAEERFSLKMAVFKNIQRDIFVYVKNFQEFQRSELLTRESFYRGLTDTSRMYSDFESKPLEDALKNLAEILVRDIGVKLAWVGRVPPNERWEEILATAGDAKDYSKDLRISVDPKLPEGNGPAGMTLRSVKPFVMNDFEDPRFEPWIEKARKYGLGASANTSFMTEDGSRWSISLYNEIGKKFPKHMEDLLIDLAMNLKLFIESKKRAHDLERMREYRDAIEKIQRKLLKSPSPESIYSLVVGNLSEHTDAQSVDISVSEEGSEWMKTIASSGEAAKVLINSKVISKDPQNIPYGQTVTSRAFRTGKTVVIEDPDKDPYLGILWSKHPELRVKSIRCWPIFGEYQRSPVAMLTIGSHDPNYFNPDLQRLIGQMVSNIEIAVNQHRQRKKIEWMGLHDPLTTLPNRIYFEQSAKEAMARARRNEKRIAFGIMDLDDFKKWNDTFGHIAGDDLLKKIGKNLKSAVRAGDGVARIGGDEFVFHISFDKVEDLQKVSERILNTVSMNERDGLILTCSLGWAVYPDDGTNLRILLIRADKVMYSSKRMDRNTYRIFDEEKHRISE